MFIKMLLLQLAFVLLFRDSMAVKEIPSFVNRCKMNSKISQCYTKTFYEMMPYMAKGIPEMDIPPLDPLHIEEAKLSTGDGDLVDLDIQIFDTTVYGLQYAKMKNLHMDFVIHECRTQVYVPAIRIETGYRVKGKVMMFDLDTTGHASFNATDISADGVWVSRFYNKGNKKHINIDKVLFDNVGIYNMEIRLDDLFQDAVLTETANKVINDNIPMLRAELEPIFKEAIGDILREFFNRVYRRFPMNQLYLDDNSLEE